MHEYSPKRIKRNPASSSAVSNHISRSVRIGSATDPLEREADSLADHIMGLQQDVGKSNTPAISTDVSTVRRTMDSPYSITDGRIVEGESDEEEPQQIQTKSIDSAGEIASPGASASIDAAIRQSGSPLPDTTRTFMEGRFGHDFSRVRVHTNEVADNAAQSVQARAFTLGENIVFARGEYAPNSQSGHRLLAHELTHVIQQGKSHRTQSGVSPLPPITKDRSTGIRTLRRIRWNTAIDTGKDSYPWGSGPLGDVYEVETNAGKKIDAWKPHNGKTYWCHGYTFGGWNAANGPFSIWGSDVPTVLADDGWLSTNSCLAQTYKDILVFKDNQQLVMHSGIITSVSAPGSAIDEAASMLNSKWGQGSQNVSSWEKNALQYGRYQVYSKHPNQGPCSAPGANEG